MYSLRTAECIKDTRDGTILIIRNRNLATCVAICELNSNYVVISRTKEKLGCTTIQVGNAKFLTHKWTSSSVNILLYFISL